MNAWTEEFIVEIPGSSTGKWPQFSEFDVSRRCCDAFQERTRQVWAASIGRLRDG
jgi:hypothetical protein